MAQRDKILDGLAWASLSEPARVARIAATLVRDLEPYKKSHNKTRIKDEVKKTSPPYGRGKAICEAVTVEYLRQLPIYRERQKAQDDWKAYQKKQSLRETRLNNAYAAAFGRPPFSPKQQFPGGWTDWDARREWDEKEDKRDKGDECKALIRYKGHVVCLIVSTNGRQVEHIATIGPDRTVVRTYLRANYHGPKNLTEAAVSLGGPKVKAALAKGKKVETDWVGRRTFIHHDGQDHVYPHIEEIPWRAHRVTRGSDIYGDTYSYTPIIVLGDSIIDDNAEEEKGEESTSGDIAPSIHVARAKHKWNDYD